MGNLTLILFSKEASGFLKRWMMEVFKLVSNFVFHLNTDEILADLLKVDGRQECGDKYQREQHKSGKSYESE